MDHLMAEKETKDLRLKIKDLSKSHQNKYLKKETNL